VNRKTPSKTVEGEDCTSSMQAEMLFFKARTVSRKNWSVIVCNPLYMRRKDQISQEMHKFEIILPVHFVSV
jgi:hypothetical protein